MPSFRRETRTRTIVLAAALCLGVFLYLAFILSREPDPDRLTLSPPAMSLASRPAESEPQLREVEPATPPDAPAAVPSASPAPPEPVARIAPARVAPEPSAAPSICIVRPDDTLTGLAKRYLGSARRWREIARLNSDRLDDPHRLRPGMRLRLPPRNPEAGARYSRYVVQEGDSLYGLAVRFYGGPDGIRLLREANLERLAGSSELKPGMLLDLPPRRAASLAEGVSRTGSFRYTVREGETLSSIAEQFYGRIDAYGRLLEANPGIDDPRNLRAGSIILIPPQAGE